MQKLEGIRVNITSPLFLFLKSWRKWMVEMYAAKADILMFSP